MYKKLVEELTKSVKRNAEQSADKAYNMRVEGKEKPIDISYWEGKRDAYLSQLENLEHLTKEVEDKLSVFQADAKNVTTFTEHIDEYNFDLAKEELRTNFNKHDMDQLHIFLDRCLETLNIVRAEFGDKGRVTPAPEQET